MSIEDILMHDESLFKNINAFDPDYIPPNYNYRDSQMEAMAIAIRPALSGGQPSNAVVMGSPATGKTTAIRKVFELVEKSTEKVDCVYINCQIHTTRFGIFSQVHKKLFGFTPPDTGVPFARIYDKCMKELQSKKKALIVALDDVDYLFQGKYVNKIFYDLLRGYEEYSGVRVAIFAILSDLEFRFNFDKNVNSVFIPQDITFKPYSYSQIEGILKDRINAGFFPDVVSDEILEEIATYTYEAGDLRVGINLLKSCGNIAESDASKQITQQHFEKAVGSIVSIQISETIHSLDDDERMVLKAIAEYDGVYKTGELIGAVKKTNKISNTSVNRILDKLEFLRLIDTPYIGKGSVGNTRQIILRFNPDEYKI